MCKMLFLYSVMQLDGDSFCGDVVLVSFNMLYSDEDSILDQKYEKRIFQDLYYENFKIIRRNKEYAFLKIQHITTRNSKIGFKCYCSVCMHFRIIL